MERIDINVKQLSMKWYIIQIFKEGYLDKEHLVTTEQLKTLLESLPQ